MIKITDDKPKTLKIKTTYMKIKSNISSLKEPFLNLAFCRNIPS